MGDGPVQKLVILNKLNGLATQTLRLTKDGVAAGSPEQQWISEAKALMHRLGITHSTRFNALAGMQSQYPDYVSNGLQVAIRDAMAEIELELELDGQTGLGNTYAPGEVYKYFAALKEIVRDAKHEMLLVDPYFDGESFDAYFGHIEKGGARIRILTDKHYLTSLLPYAKKHVQEHGSQIEVRRSGQLHDRILFVDGDACWITGGSFRDAGKKASYLLPLPQHLVPAKLAVYAQFWADAAREL